MEAIEAFARVLVGATHNLQVIKVPNKSRRREIVVIAGYTYTRYDFEIIARFVLSRHATVCCFAESGTFVPHDMQPGETPAGAIGRVLTELGAGDRYYARPCARNTLEEVRAIARREFHADELSHLTIVAGDLHALRFALTMERQAPSMVGLCTIVSPYTWRSMPTEAWRRRAVQEGYRIAAYQHGSLTPPRCEVKIALDRMLAFVEKEMPALHEEMLAETAAYRAAHSA